MLIFQGESAQKQHKHSPTPMFFPATFGHYMCPNYFLSNNMVVEVHLEIVQETSEN